MKVSIIIPSYNQEQYLRESIESALSQTYEDKEIIVVDDGSTDNSLEIANSFQIVDLSYTGYYRVISQVNKGLASARNTGIMNATGDLVFPLDADDIMVSTCIEQIVDVAQKTDADVIAPSIQCFGVGNDIVTLMADPKLEDFKQGNRIAYCSAVKRKVLLDIGGYSPKMVEGYEDLHLWINLLTRGKKIVTIPTPLVLYRTKSESMWTEAKKNHDKLMEQIYKDFPAYA